MIVALIPAKGTSTRLPGKNVRPLAGHPLLAYSIAVAQESGLFGDEIYCSTESSEVATLAESYGARPIMRPRIFSQPFSPDIQWVHHALGVLKCRAYEDEFVILRPTNPFRTAARLRQAYGDFKASGALSLRQIRPVREHPGKVWTLDCLGRIHPFLTDADPKRWYLEGGIPWHSAQTQLLPAVYVQTAGLEISYVAKVAGIIFVDDCLGWLAEGYEGVDINTEEDWELAERIAAEHPEALPRVRSLVQGVLEAEAEHRHGLGRV